MEPDASDGSTSYRRIACARANRGVEAIRKVTNLQDKRATYHALETGALPGFKDGGRWCLRLVTYLKHLEAKEAEALAERQAAKTAKAAALAANGSEDQVALPTKPRRPPPRRSRPKPAAKTRVGRAGHAEP